MKKVNNRLGILGMGRMGRCFVNGILDSGQYKKKDLFFTTFHEDTGKKMASELGINRCASNTELVKKSSVVMLAVKPQSVNEVLEEVGDQFEKEHTLVSIAASVDTEQIEKKLPAGVPVLRAMPNTPAFVQSAMTAICLGQSAKKKHLEAVTQLFAPLGRVVQVEERQMNAVTGLSGCGPAYIYVVLEALTEGGLKMGLPRDLASELAAQTVLGAAKMLQETGRHPSSLRDEVTTPAGCTIDGLVELEEGKLRVTLMKAVVKATERARVLAGS